MTYEPLHHMTRTGSAIIDADGVMIESGEYVAALYETYAADADASDYRNGHNAQYQVTAQGLAEDLWTRDIHEVS